MIKAATGSTSVEFPRKIITAADAADYLNRKSFLKEMRSMPVNILRRTTKQKILSLPTNINNLWPKKAKNLKIGRLSQRESPFRWRKN